MSEIHIKKDKNKNFKYALIFVLLFLLISTVIDASYIIKNAFIKEAFLVILASLFCFIIIRYMVTEFIYTFEKNQLVIRKKLGKKTKIAHVIPYDKIIALSKKDSEIIKKYKKVTKLNATLNIFSKNGYVILYKLNEETISLSIELNDEIRSNLEKHKVF